MQDSMLRGTEWRIDQNWPKQADFTVFALDPWGERVLKLEVQTEDICKPVCVTVWLVASRTYLQTDPGWENIEKRVCEQPAM